MFLQLAQSSHHLVVEVGVVSVGRMGAVFTTAAGDESGHWPHHHHILPLGDLPKWLTEFQDAELAVLVRQPHVALEVIAAVQALLGWSFAAVFALAEVEIVVQEVVDYGGVGLVGQFHGHVSRQAPPPPTLFCGSPVVGEDVACLCA